MSDDTAMSGPTGWLSGLQRGLLALATLALLGLGGAACAPSYPDCDNDGHCASHDEFCVDSRCVQCRTEQHCSSIDRCMTCQDNACVRKPGCCKSALDCPEGRCIDGVCGPECAVNSDCPGEQNCVRGKCTDRTGCEDDSHCPEGLRCVDGQCTTADCDVVPIYFDFNEYAIRLDQEKTLGANGACLKQSNVQRIQVEGHCDERGSDEYNLILGQRRANSVLRTYKALGYSGQGRTLSWGEEQLKCSGSNERCWRQNRRVETVIK